MAIRLEDEYTYKNAASVDYPHGSFKNASTPTSKDGTPLEEKWANDVYGFLQALLAAGGVTPSGVPDTAVASDYLTALHMVVVAHTPSTGDAKLTMKTAPDAGWIMADNGTIGAAGSGASNRANVDCEALFTLLWNNIADTYAPVTGGRGANAAADWAGGKVIRVGTILGRALGVAGAGSGLTARALGTSTGVETVTLDATQIPGHTHSVTWTETEPSSGTDSGAGVLRVDTSNDATNQGANSITSGSTGGGLAHSNMQPTVFLNLMIKL